MKSFKKSMGVKKKLMMLFQKVSVLDIKIPIELSKILVSRGITDFNSAEHYFRPKKQHFHDAFLMKGMNVSSLD